MTKENNIQKSPVIKSPRIFISFSEAMKVILTGKKVTKAEWNNPEICFYIENEFLVIKGVDGKPRQFIIRECDIAGHDFYTVD